MSAALVRNVSIKGIASAVPKNEVPLSNDLETFGETALRRIISSTGIESRRMAPDGMRASDLCQVAAERLISNLGWSPDSVGLIIFVSQTPDYLLPSTACTLQNRLGLSKSAAAFDVSLGCSGYVYGLWIASALVASLGTTRALILVGDTLTRNISPSDRKVWPLFGDAGSATAIEIDFSASEMYFEFGTDGSGYEHLIADRQYSTDGMAPTLKMNGVEVFSFTLREVPPMVRRLLEFSQIDPNTIDQWVLHQANEFVLRNLQKRLKINDDRMVIDVAKWGNTSGASIPLAVCSSLRHALTEKDHQLLIAGFGVGLSWGGAIVKISKSIVIPEIIELDQVKVS